MKKTVEKLRQKFISKWLVKTTVQHFTCIDNRGRPYPSTQTTSEDQPKAERDLDALIEAVIKSVRERVRGDDEDLIE